MLSIVLKIEKKLEKDLEEEYLLLVLPCPRGGNPPFYTGEFREEEFSETGFPLQIILENPNRGR